MTDQISNSALHYTIIRFIIDNGYAPEIAELSELLKAPREEVFAALQKLQEDHGIVLHPNSPRIWVAHPFSMAPSIFLVSSANSEWWGNCAWCSLGIMMWEFSKVWYGNHLNPEWKKWTADEAQRMFDRFELPSPIWKIPVSDSRF